MIGTSGPHRLGFGQELEPAHPRHVDVGQDQDERLVAGIGDALQRHGGGLRKFHRKAAGAEIAPEMLAKQQLDIRLIVDHKNKQIHVFSPDLAMVAAARGRTIRNSVNCARAAYRPR